MNGHVRTAALQKKTSQASLLVTLVIQSMGKLYVSFVSFDKLKLVYILS